MQTERTYRANEESVLSVPLVRHLAVIIALKLGFLFLLWFLFFRQAGNVTEPGSDIEDHIAGPVSAAVSLQPNEERP